PEQCTLCPRACKAQRAAGEHGVCGAGAELMVARAALHFWEEPAISGKSGSGTVFFSHCPLRCVYCQNHEIAAGSVGRSISIDRLAQIFLELQEAGALNINLVTPTHYVSQIIQALDMARAAGLALPIVYNTSGYETAETIHSLAGYVDVYLSDFKYWSNEQALRYSHAPTYPECACVALDAMVEQTGPLVFCEQGGEGLLLKRGTVVRHMMLPEMLEDSKKLVSYLWERYGKTIALSLMNQYTPLRSFPEFPELDNRVPPSDYEALLDFADAMGIEDYFWQEGDAVGESFIPPFDGQGVERVAP
ncbi:MAG: radical SAM protein, partial [Raoultibacter sp.]